MSAYVCSGKGSVFASDGLGLEDGRSSCGLHQFAPFCTRNVWKFTAADCQNGGRRTHNSPCLFPRLGL